ncbi:MAG TPA: TetR/AcrR family transcriptional regulator [Thermoanaerobaculia bacterium]|nr:TetR/AcrR family transcriptional regulator [Thermoanaerobaculia bacterium]
MTVQDPDSTQTSRMRLLNAGKTLFAKSGYEQTSTAAIAREAGSSESQLIRYFGGKAGLLEAIFNDSWTGLNARVEAVLEGAQHGREGILRLLSLMMRALSQDLDIAFLFLFEGRRMRGHSPEVLLSKGFGDFMKHVLGEIERGREDGSFRTDLDPRVIASAIFGAAEGMVRDRVLTQRNHLPENPFSDEQVLAAYSAMVDGLAPVKS